MVCLFIFCLYVDSEYLTLPTLSSTELVKHKKPPTSTFVFQKSTVPLAILASPILFLDTAKAIFIAYNQLQQVKFIAFIKKGYAYTFSLVVLPIKTIPTDSKEAHFPFLVD